jgi:putative addiction module antidote
VDDKLRKVVKVGNSLGVTIPSEILEEKKIKQGDNLTVEIDERGNIVLKQVSIGVTGLGLKELSKYKGVISEERAKEWIEETDESRNHW